MAWAYRRQHLVHSQPCISQSLHSDPDFEPSRVELERKETIHRVNTFSLSRVYFPDYVSAFRVALLNQLDITILAITGSSMQFLLFNLPVLVILGWIINEPMTLSLQFFETSTVFLGVFIVRYVVVDDKSNYLYDAMCIAL